MNGLNIRTETPPGEERQQNTPATPPGFTASEVLISICGLHTVENEETSEDEIEVIYPGRHVFRNGRHFLEYEEVLDTSQTPLFDERIKTRITLSMARPRRDETGAGEAEPKKAEAGEAEPKQTEPGEAEPKKAGAGEAEPKQAALGQSVRLTGKAGEAAGRLEILRRPAKSASPANAAGSAPSANSASPIPRNTNAPSAETRMAFEPGKTCISLYPTPMGRLPLGFHVYEMEVTDKASLLEIRADYGIELEGEHLSDSRICIRVTPKDDALSVAVYDK